jgi:predicted metal-dependent peptidase
MEESRFERSRKQLFQEVLQSDNHGLKPDFNRKFLELIELCNLSLMESKDNFFALFFVQIKREISFESKVALATKISGTNFVMYFNP